MAVYVPTAMRDRWRDRVEPPVGQGTVYWHVLMRDHPAVVEAATEAQNRLAGFPGLHRTPGEWFHMTMFVAGATESVSAGELDHLLRRSQEEVDHLDPIRITAHRVLHHPEAIMLAVDPVDELRTLARTIGEATQHALGARPARLHRIDSWIPHVTVAYSTAAQGAAAIVGAVGRSVRPRTALLERVSLVNQWGPERDWDWEVVGDIHMGGRHGGTT